MTQLSNYRKIKFKSKIKELFNRSYKFVDYSSHDSVQQHLIKKDSMDEIINELATMSTKYNTMVGRVVKIKCDNSYAYYVIKKVNKSTVRIDWIDYGDYGKGLVHDYFQKAALVDINFITKQLSKQNTL